MPLRASSPQRASWTARGSGEFCDFAPPINTVSALDSTPISPPGKMYLKSCFWLEVSPMSFFLVSLTPFLFCAFSWFFRPNNWYFRPNDAVATPARRFMAVYGGCFLGVLSFEAAKGPFEVHLTLGTAPRLHACGRQGGGHGAKATPTVLGHAVRHAPSSQPIAQFGS